MGSKIIVGSEVEIRSQGFGIRYGFVRGLQTVLEKNDTLRVVLNDGQQTRTLVRARDCKAIGHQSDRCPF